METDALKFLHQSGAAFILVMFAMQLLSNWRIAKDLPLLMLSRRLEWARETSWPKLHEYVFRQQDARQGKYGEKVQQEAKTFLFFLWFGAVLWWPGTFYELFLK